MKQDEAREFMLRAAGQEEGQPWVELLLHKHARVLFELQWMVFQLGQGGAFFEVVESDKARGSDMMQFIEQVEECCDDLEEAAADVASVARDIMANARRNLEKMTR